MSTLVALGPVPAARWREVAALFAQAWWTSDRSPEHIAAMLTGGSTTVGLVEDGRLVAFARALCDGVFKALVVDVIVEDCRRGDGLGHVVVDALLAQPSLADIREVELYCHPRHEAFYKEHGFTTPPDTVLMRRRNGPPA